MSKVKRAVLVSPADKAAKSEGARLERKAFRAYLRREIKKPLSHGTVLGEVLAWVLGRQNRYDKRQGGL